MSTTFLINILEIHDKYPPFKFLRRDMGMFNPIRTWVRDRQISVAETMVYLAVNNPFWSLIYKVKMNSMAIALLFRYSRANIVFFRS